MERLSIVLTQFYGENLFYSDEIKFGHISHRPDGRLWQSFCLYVYQGQMSRTAVFLLTICYSVEAWDDLSPACVRAK